MRFIHGIASYTPDFVTPNRLSWFRIWIIPFLWLSYLAHPLLAFVLYTVACITDWLDGYLARTRGLITSSGKRLDEVSDKLLAVGVLTLLFATGRIAFDGGSFLFWCVAIIVIRECVITTLREVWPERGKRIQSLLSAKAKTAVMMAGFGLLILGGLSHPLWQQMAHMGKLLVFISMLLALWSGGLYVWLFFKTGR